MKNSRLFDNIVVVALCLASVSCGTKRNLVGDVPVSVAGTAGSEKTEAMKIDFLRKVYDNEVYVKSISSKIKFTLTSGSKDITVSGSLRMKRDEVIRIQLTPFGLLEAGRIEFAKDYVLIMDRINKEYIKAGYGDVDFLRDNGLDFYFLQALFWNQLFVPGEQKMTDSSLKNFDVLLDDAMAGVTISLICGNMTYRWAAGKGNGQIKSVDVMYDSKTNGETSVGCAYGAFKPLGKKNFPADIVLSMRSDAVRQGKNITMRISMGDFDTSEDWETNTDVSGKYKKVSVEDVMNRIMKM